MDYAMGWTKYNLILLGVWPDPGTAHSRQLSSFVFWSTVFVTVTFVNVPQMAYLILRSTNLDEAIENLSVNVPIMFALSKHVALRYHRRELALLVREVMNNWSGPLTKSDRQLMLKNAVISRSISIVLSSFAYVMYIAFVILQVMSNIQDSSKIELKGLLHPSIFPYDTRKSPNLQISWLGQFIGSGSMALSYSSFDSLLAILVLHLCGQLSILRNALEDLANRNHQAKFKERLVYIVRRHNELSRYAVMLEECFNVMLLVQTLMCTVMLCMTGYRLISSMDHEEEKIPIYVMIFCIMHVVTTMLHFFAYCFVGEMLARESTGIAQSAYDSIWYDLPPKQAAMMIIIIHRAGVSLKITAGKFSPFSLELFNDVLKTSAGYLSVLLAMKDLALQGVVTDFRAKKKRTSMRPSTELASQGSEISWWSLCRVVFTGLVSMDFERDLKDAIGWNRFNLRIVGIWPEPMMLHEHIADLRAFVSVLSIMIFATIWQSVDLFMVNNDLSQITSILSLANIPAYNSAFKLIFVWYYRKDLQPIIKSFYDDWHAPKTQDERDTMVDSAKFCKHLSIWCTVLTQSMLFAYVGTRSFAIATCDINTVQQDHLTIYPAYYPFDLRRMPYRIAANVGQVIAAYCALIPYTSVDIFIATLVLHTCGQFTNLNKRLSRLMDGQNGTIKSDDIQEELTSIVKRHEHLNWVAGRIDKCFSLLLLIQMLLSTLEICFQGFLFFNVMLKSGDGLLNFQMLFFVLFISFIIVHMYVYCYVGELLRVQSSEMAVAAYDSSWYNVAPPEAKCLIFIMLRSTRPLCLTAGKFGIFSMEMFSTILRTALGYLSVLVTVSSVDD
ncbi:uncharacterized protein LOC144470680 [Augochlora pura]